MAKAIKFNTPEGQFYIPLKDVATRRANHYRKEKDEWWENEFQFGMEDENEAIDWIINNTNYDDWWGEAVKLNNKVKVTTEDFWSSTDDFEIIELE